MSAEAIARAIADAKAKLPEGWTVVVRIEKDYLNVELYDDINNEIGCGDPPDDLAEAIQSAVSVARD